MSNLPNGAENDSRAPWNEYDNLCRYCDADVLYDFFIEEVSKDLGVQMMEFDSEEDYLEFLHEQAEFNLSEHGLCKQCAKEEYYDDDDDRDL